MSTTIPPRSAHVALATPAAVKSCMPLLDKAATLLTYQVDSSQPAEQQLESIRPTLRTIETTSRLLETKCRKLQGLYDTWSHIIQTLPVRDPPEMLQAEQEAFAAMHDDPNGLYAIIDGITTRIEELKFLSDDLDVIQQRMQPVPVNSPPVATHTNTPTHTPVSQASIDQIAAASAHHTPSIDSIRLPKVDLPTFDGNPLQWFDFWALFEVTIHKQLHLSKTQKMAYLFGCLRGQARDATRGYHLHEDNYDTVIQALHLQFGNKSALGRQLHEELRQLRNPAHNSADLMRYHNDTCRIIHQMELAGIDTQSEHLIFDLEDHLSANTKMLMYPEKVKHHPYTPKVFQEILFTIARMLADVDAPPYHPSPRDRGDRDVRRQQGGSERHKSGPQREGQERSSYVSPSSPALRKSSAFAQLYQKPKRGQNQRSQPHWCIPQPRSQPLRNRMPPTPCVFCGGMHWNYACDQYSSPHARRDRATELSRCFLCLRTGHSQRDCSARTCSHCGNRHHSLLCLTHSDGPGGSTRANAATEAESASYSRDEESLNATVTVPQSKKRPRGEVPLLLWQSAPVCNPRVPGTFKMAKIFLDQGSQSSFVTERFAKSLGLRTRNRGPLTIHGVGSGNSHQVPSAYVSLGMKLTDGSVHTVEARTLPQVTNAFLHAEVDSSNLADLRDEKEDELSLPLIYGEPDILIGANFITTINPRLVQRLRSGFAVYDSELGPLVGGSGHVQSIHNPEPPRHAATVLVGMAQISLDDFTSLDKLGINEEDEAIEDDARALMTFEKSIHRLPDGRYSVSWPFKPGQPKLATNYGLCIGRLRSLLHNLAGNREGLRLYHDTIMQHVADGIIEPVPNQATGPLVHYVPHQAVWNEEKKKLRVVYDASSSAPRGQALNDNLLRGPVFLPDLVGQLMRLRNAAIAIIADVEKAFLQIQLNEGDRDVTRFLWVRNPEQPIGQDNPITAYRFRRVFFGAVSSPFLLAATIRHHLRNSNSRWASQLIDNIYVDNVLLVVDSEATALDAYHEAKSLFAEAQMNVRDFISNSQSVNKAIPQSDRYGGSSVKVLGLMWNTVADTLTVNTLPPPTEAISKRVLLRYIAQHFDPLGFVSPSVLLLKVLLQKIMKDEVHWDSPVSSTQATEWKRLKKEWHAVPFTVPRRIPKGPLELHIFSDASAFAYATAIYVKGSTGVHLIFAKSRLCPIKGLSIPRLELLAVLIGVRASNFVIRQFRWQSIARTLWTDSKCALAWIRSSKVDKLSRFVKNRLDEIHGTEGISYAHVPTADNPADLGTRGLLPQDLANSAKWRHGPSWLKEDRSLWPTQPTSQNSESDDAEEVEISTEANALAAITPHSTTEDSFVLMDPNRFSSWIRMVEAATWTLRFITKLSGNRIKFLAKMSISGPLCVAERRVASICLIRQAQSNLVTDRDIARWDLQKDADGIWRCVGRLATTNLPRDKKYPVFLPRRSEITKLIILHSHQALMHGGVASTLAHLRSRHWIPHGRRTVRSVIQDRCLQCRRWSCRPFTLPNAPPLPAERTQRSPPFAHTAVDYFGPINVKATMGTAKRWVALFTCFATRAIHLEVANDLSASAFTDCFRRFIARRGVPKVMLSDNGTNFKLTASALKEVRDYLGNQLVEWRFVTALTPWKGGLYERLVGIVKTSMRKTVGNRLLTETQLATLVTEVEAVVNQRPLTYVESDSLEVLRPIDFLVPKAVLMLNVDHSTDSDEWMPGAPSTRIALLRQWSRTQQYLEQFWKAWQISYLAMLRERARFKHAGPYRQTKRAPHVGEVVLVRETNVPRGMWKLGQVTKTPMGTGDVIRSAEVRTASGRTILRPISLLYPLEVSSEADSKALPDHEEDSARWTKKVETSTQERRVTRSMTRGNPQVGEAYVPPVLPPL